MRITPVTVYRNTILNSKNQNEGVSFGKFDKNEAGEEDISILKDYYAGISFRYLADMDLFNFFKNTEFFTLKRGVKLSRKKMSLPYIVKNQEAIDKNPHRGEILKICDKLNQDALRRAQPGSITYKHIEEEPGFVTELNLATAIYIKDTMRNF